MCKRFDYIVMVVITGSFFDFLLEQFNINDFFWMNWKSAKV